MTKTQLLADISEICRTAGAAILEIYQLDDLGIQTKSDNSPITDADMAAHNIIEAGLAKIAPEIPVLSEESVSIPFATRSSWSRYFLVDPLDGTKEFINRNGEFTVNIALIEDHKPTLGVVYVPVEDVLYAGINDEDMKLAYVERDGDRADIRTRPVQADNPGVSASNLTGRFNNLTVVASRRHNSNGPMTSCMNALEAQFNVTLKSVGSSLKFCQIAEGQADLYPRLAPTSEWDTGAAQAVVEAAGGLVVDGEFNPLRYNTKENILNPHFYVLADPSYDWRAILPISKG